MKKTLTIIGLAALTVAASYGQGYISYGGFLNGIKNNYTTPGTPVNTAGLYVQLFFAPSGSSSVSTIAASSTTAANYTTATAWSLITGDSTFASVNGAGGTGTVANGITTGNGGFAATTFAAANLTAGVTYKFYEVAWYAGAGGTDTTIALASAAGDYVGWSQVFNYTTTASTVPPPTAMSSALVGNFVVGGTIAPAPEPGTMALAALGGASLLLFRRRNK